MPFRPPRACTFPGCKAIAVVGRDYCEAHLPKPEFHTRAERIRENPYRKLYNTAQWLKNVRPFVLARDPVCKLQLTDLCRQHGGDPTTICDHKIDHKGVPTLFFDTDNCQGVCKPCHDMKTGFTGGGKRVAVHAENCLISMGVCTCDVGRST